ncbi:hypothetical protein BKA82DRAFT_994206 [Pisolithus tinctorius]|uniref:Uncharacterized protein n=1 Tax=Pisolithus tinctorius Marx 270 TaxID=870435 RepID=A0A0C3PU50_PISTI|nr:hypothetical protein BKA82DRAFT_994206 [Pisolithus tinctorius]KIO12289.1 hypothetical protein M404DRAFT_994206 [Pisolithus tinctorius Marx 270]
MNDAVRDFSHGLEEVLRHYTPVSSIDLSTLGDRQYGCNGVEKADSCFVAAVLHPVSRSPISRSE